MQFRRYLGALLFVVAVVPFGVAHADTSVSIVDDAYSPASITITAGTSVTWTNTGMMMHTVTADNGSFDSGTITSGQQFSHMFMTPGTYTYHCNFHSNMHGTIIVTGSSPQPNPNPNPTPNPNPQPQPYPSPMYPQQNYQQLYWCGTYYSYSPCQNQMNYGNSNYNGNYNYSQSAYQQPGYSYQQTNYQQPGTQTYTSMQATGYAPTQYQSYQPPYQYQRPCHTSYYQQPIQYGYSYSAMQPSYAYSPPQQYMVSGNYNYNNNYNGYAGYQTYRGY